MMQSNPQIAQKLEEEMQKDPDPKNIQLVISRFISENLNQSQQQPKPKE